MSMSAEQEQFFRAELARTPAQFMRMTPSEIETELDRRWAARVPDGMMLEEGCTGEGVVGCTSVDKSLEAALLRP